MPVNVAELLGQTGDGGTGTPAAEPSLWDKTGGAFFAGAYQDPIVHAVIGNPEDDKNAAEIQYATRNSTVADIMGVVGKFAPGLVTGIGSFAAGRYLGAAAAEGLSETAAAYGARTAVDQFVAKPLVLRAGEIAGGALGSGAEAYGRGLLEGDTQTDALKRGAVGAALVGGTETALTGAAKILTRKLVPVSRMMERDAPDALEFVNGLKSKLQLIDDTINATGETPELLAAKRSTLRSLGSLKSTKALDVLASGMADHEAVFAKESERIGMRIQEVSTEKLLADMQNGFGLAFGVPDMAEAGAKRSAQFTRRIENMKALKAEKDTLVGNAQRYKDFFRDPLNVEGRVPNPDVPLSPNVPVADALYLGEPRGPATTTRIGGVTFGADYKNFLNTVKVNVLQSPETAAKQLGMTMTRALRDWSEASNQSRNLTLAFVHKRTQVFQELADTMGQPFDLNAGTTKDLWGLKLFHEYEKGGLKQVEQVYGPAVSAKLDEVMQLDGEAKGLRGLVRRYGVQPDWDEATKQYLGVQEHVPQIMLPTGEQITNKHIMQTQRYMAQQGKQLSFEQARDMLIKLDRSSDGGMRRVGSLDFQRLFPGTTYEKHLAYLKGDFPFPVETDPWRALNENTNGIAHRISFASVFGPNMEMKAPLAEAAIAEGADPVRVHALLDQLMGTNPVGEATYKISRVLTNFQVLSKLGLAAIQNAFQSINNPLAVGFRNSAKGLMQMLAGNSEQEMAGALGALHGMHDNIRDVLQAELTQHSVGAIQDAVMGVRRNNPGDALVRFMLKWNAFSPTEGFNRMLAGNTGLVTIRDTVGKAVAGRLRGDTLARAERMMDNLGVNLPAIVKRAQAQGLYGTPLGTEEIDNLVGKQALVSHMWRAAQVLQFIPDQTRVPLWWSHPVGKVLTQFKSFAFNQSKLIRDVVLREAGEGNLKPLATMMTVYPAVGTMTNAVSGVFGRQQRPGAAAQYLDALLAPGGIGLAYNLGVGFHYKDPSVMIGPTGGDVFDFVSAMFQQDTLGALGAKLSRYPTYRLFKTLSSGALGAADLGGKKVMELYDEANPSGRGEALKPADLSVLLRQGNPANK
jgi:hypothetical protein